MLPWIIVYVVLRDSLPLDELVVLLLSCLTNGDSPFSSAVLENAIGKATDILGPKLVTRIHINCELEDRLALTSVRRFESGNTDLTLSSNEVDYLLSRRL
jgi:hypothetical protein